MCKQGTIAPIIGAPEVFYVDECISGLVQTLNTAGYTTIASCCGHGNRPGNIALRNGKELIIAPDFKTARLIGSLFPDVHGEVHAKYIAHYGPDGELYPGDTDHPNCESLTVQDLIYLVKRQTDQLDKIRRLG